MYYQNLVIIEGHLTKNPELKKSKNGKSYSFFSVCFNSLRKRDTPNDKGYMYDTEPNFYNVNTWNKTAEEASSLKKGDAVSIVGKILQNDYENKDGERIRNVYVLANSIKKITKTEIKNRKKEVIANEITDALNYSDFPDEIPF